MASGLAFSTVPFDVLFLDLSQFRLDEVFLVVLQNVHQRRPPMALMANPPSLATGVIPVSDILLPDATGILPRHHIQRRPGGAGADGIRLSPDA